MEQVIRTWSQKYQILSGKDLLKEIIQKEMTRTLLKNKNIIVLRPGRRFLMWELPSTLLIKDASFIAKRMFIKTIKTNCDYVGYELFALHYLEAMNIMNKSSLQEKAAKRNQICMEISEAWINADKQIRYEYETLATQLFNYLKIGSDN